MKSTLGALFTVAVTLLQSGCGCDTYAAPSLSFTALDAATRAPIVTQEATIVIRDGAFVDSSRVLPGTGNFFERAGTYQVTIEAPGYRKWEQRGLRVGHDGCHVKTARFTAFLERASVTE